jgi:amino acid adenylation domain-containing protein/non-ribosomal peptide synthase protein (TIGR01720 family)
MSVGTVPESRQAELRELEAQLLLLESLKVAGRQAQVPALRRRSQPGPCPASFAQERLWWIDRLMPGSALYNIASAVVLDGALGANVLARCLTEIVRRHEVLRTTFETVDGGCVQVLSEASVIPLPVVDLGALAPGSRAGEVHRLATLEAGRRFDLKRLPLLAATLLRLGRAEHVLLFTMHHIVSDGWSTGIFVRELVALYQAFLAGRPSPLPELALQYGDFAVWHRQWLDGEVRERETSYWRESLTGMPQQLALPVDRPHPRLQTFRGAACSTSLEASQVAALSSLARAEGATLFMVLLAALEILLARHSGQAGFGIGTPVAGRSRAELEGLIGFFVNTLVLRADLAKDPSFRVFLGEVRQTTLAAYDHQHLPFEKLVEELAPERSLNRSPLFQVMYTHEVATPSDLRIPGLAIRPLEAASRAAKFDLTLATAETASGLVATLVYNPDLADAATARRLLAHWQILLGAIAADPGARTTVLPLLSGAEAHQLLHEWSTAGEDPLGGRPASLPALFGRQVTTRPDASALSFAGGVWSYRELDHRARRLAGRLRHRGVGPGARVAVCLERSPEMVAGLLAILRVGAAYLPIDSSYPTERKAFLLADSDVVLLLTQTDLLGVLPPGGPGVLCVDRPEEGDERGEERDPALTAAPAYVIYTSGSTGQPKGVLVPHANVSRLFAVTEERFRFGPADVWTLFHSYAFDFSIWELWGALLHGGRLVIVPPGVSRSPDLFYELLCDEGVTVLNQTPGAFRQLVWVEQAALRRQTDSASALAALRLVIFGGEALELASLAPWFARHGDHRPALVNMYGITETTVHVTYRRLRRGDLAASGSAIGRPLADLAGYLLGPGSQPVPIGAPGELYVGGAGLALGYLGRPPLTAERFVPDPFATFGSGGRLYRTGDLARHRPNGELEYLGRVDQQVKIRGFRIELGEIEATLTAHPEVREAVVQVRDGSDGDRRLVAYVVGPDGRRPLAADLKRYLGERLPAYMVPGTFVVLEKLPLTSHGKVDRRALPAPEEAGEGWQEEAQAPLGPIEELIAEIYGEVLGRGSVERDGDFFALGGHSLLATQVISRLHQACGVELPLLALFEAPTVAGLAERVEGALRGDSGLVVPPIKRVPRDGPLALSFAQQRLWFIDRLEPGGSAYNITMALRFTGPLDLPVLAAALTEIVRRHEVLRTRIETVAGRPRPVIAPPATVVLPVLDLRGLPESMAWAQRLAAEEARRPFDLARGPLLRPLLLRTGEAEHAAVLNLHHIAFDGWSMGILARELGELYRAFAAGLPSPLAELPLQYADFAAWQRRWLSGEVLEELLRYWQERLAGAPEVLSLPVDRPRPAVPSHRGARRPVRWTAELTAALSRLAHTGRSTVFMVLLAAFEALLARHTGQEDLTVGTPIAGRNRWATESLIGLFVNTLALRGDLSGDPPFAALLCRVREVTLGAYAHQDLPFERLVDALQLERSLSHSPLFQVMLALQNAPRQPVALPALGLTPMAVARDTAQFDLMLELGENAGELAGALEYSTELFDETTAIRLLAHLGALLVGAVANPDARLSALSMLAPGERFQLVVEWNATEIEYPGELCLHGLVAAQIARSPEALAVVFEGQGLSYGELGSRAERLARLLRELGVGPESVVGVCLERSLELVVALLAVLEAGGAYLPLDPVYPEERLAQMMADSGAPVVVTEQSLTPRLSAVGARQVCLDTDWEVLPGRSAGAFRSGPDNAAYVIYTSGSTGRPKGVINVHRAIRNRLLWMQEAYGLRGSDRVLQKTPFSFDVSVWELFWPLITGASMVVARPQGHQDSEYLVDLIARERVTTVHFVPSMLQVFLEEPRLAECRDLKRVMVSGEALPFDLQQRFFARLPAELHNLYGPTEAAVDVTSWACRPAGAWGAVPIGRPIANTEIHLLGSDLQAIGIAGELHIGGMGLARGYLGRPELTAERFVPDPFGTNRGARLYRTGDLVRRLPGGEVEFLGRIDHQVKIRGFRIELGEIEVTLAGHPGVRETVVVAREDHPGERRLVAYVVAHAGETLAVAGLSSFLGARLPAYMVPAAFIPLAALPLLSTGKVDRRALPAPGHERPELEEDLVEARSRAERLLVAIWADVLRLERVGIHDNFFALGGDSILSIQIVARANQMGVRLIPRQIFQHPTIAGLAAAAGSVAIIDAEQGSVAGPLPLTPIQSWFFAEDLAELHYFNQSLMLTTREAVLPGLLERALGALLEHHDALRLRFAREGEGWRQWNEAPGGPIPLSRIDLGALPADHRIPALEDAAVQAQTGLDPTLGSLFRALFFRLDASERARLQLIAHHLVVDGVSWRILLGDLEVACGQLLRAEAVRLPAKTTSFKRWAERLAEHARSPTARAELDSWLASVRRGAARLPVDFEAERGSVGSSRTITVFLSAEETHSLVKEVPAASGAQVDAVLLTALAQSFRRWTGERRLLVDMEGHGREEIFDDVDLTRTVGWFTTLFPLLLELEPGAAPEVDLERIAESLRAVPGRGLGYGLLLYLGDDLAAGRLREMPRAQVVYNNLGHFDGLLTESALLSPAAESPGRTRSPRAERSHVLEIGAWVSGGCLGVSFSYSETVHRATTIEGLAQDFLGALRTLVAVTRAPGMARRTGADTSPTEVGQDELALALQEVGFEGIGDADEYEER